ncbi:3-ketoacyl-CoA synthase 6-like [Pyrus ussuriensis x Pyrus communis]|uniref:3-ketoacyl-CoA synthase 6-like n=1 Tax=Pyrus ussuriensis x Pyrus communis TaxID=2448454 RepID=A0A5N5GLW0_9ROSA|nr:3-ketoacyl-CoA synthase 6-like [Pyrus ussuriensis x Pyrus communis]
MSPTSVAHPYLTSSWSKSSPKASSSPAVSLILLSSLSTSNPSLPPNVPRSDAMNRSSCDGDASLIFPHSTQTPPATHGAHTRSKWMSKLVAQPRLQT